jgi:hypothetical protein
VGLLGRDSSLLRRTIMKYEWKAQPGTACQ